MIIKHLNQHDPHSTYGLLRSATVFYGLLLSPSAGTGSKKDVGERSFGQIKIVISFIQVVCAMPNVFDNVPWPEEFLTITFPFTVFNFDLMGLFAPAQCTLAVRYFDQFILAMVMPGLFFVAVIAAWLIFLPCNRKNKEKRASRKELMYQILILIVLCCYPGKYIKKNERQNLCFLHFFLFN